MSSFVKAGLRLINADQIVEVDVFPALPERVEYDEEEGRDITIPASALNVRVVTTVIEGCLITLRGGEAEEFLGSIRYSIEGSNFKPQGTQMLREKAGS